MAKKEFPKAKIIFDKFHVIKVWNKQLDEVRKKENKLYHELKRTEYLFLKSLKNLNKKEKTRLDELIGYQNLETVKLYGMLFKFKKIFDYKKHLMQQSFSSATTTR